MLRSIDPDSIEIIFYVAVGIYLQYYSRVGTLVDIGELACLGQGSELRVRVLYSPRVRNRDMSRRKNKPQENAQSGSSGSTHGRRAVADSDARSRLHRFAPPIIFWSVMAVASYFIVIKISANLKANYRNASPVALAPQAARRAGTLDELLAMSPEQLAELDIAEMNLLCATGLPGAESLDADKALARLDEYAERVQYWTDQSMWDFRENPDKFENSYAKFRVLLLISVLQQDFGIHYNDRGLRNVDFTNSKNPFLHGMIDDTNGGTCASMPIMYVAVGRRLGYPMTLVLAKKHIFARWEDPLTRERLNIEGTNARFDDHSDDYYRNWPDVITDAEMQLGWFLKPLTAAEELAVFLQNRAFCLLANGRPAQAHQAFTRSYQLAPQNPLGPRQINYAAQAARRQQGLRRQPRRLPSALPPMVPAAAQPQPPPLPSPAAATLDPRTNQQHNSQYQATERSLP